MAVFMTFYTGCVNSFVVVLSKVLLRMRSNVQNRIAMKILALVIVSSLLQYGGAGIYSICVI